ncbi:MAG: NAD(P)H-binding protein [Gammaproteobacteria bacterium]|nr:NAD(P)H-binding protein [Gammaproteobacteria bacterium]
MQKSEKRIFLAGAGGAIGRRLCPLLVEDGYTIYGTTRKADRVSMLEDMGVIPVVVDVFDAGALRSALVASKPDIVIHQLTDLPLGLDPALMSEARVRNARLREIGTQNLMTAAKAAQVERVVAQSIAFAYAPGAVPFEETASLNIDADDPAVAVSARAVASLEQQVLNGPFEGVVLRFGKLYGPGTGFDVAPPGGPVHVDAAADATRRAITLGEHGIYNVAEEDGTVSSARARTILKWDPAFSLQPE